MASSRKKQGSKSRDAGDSFQVVEIKGGPRWTGLFGVVAAVVLVVGAGVWFFRGGVKISKSTTQDGILFPLAEQFNHELMLLDMGVEEDGTFYMLDVKGIQVRSKGVWGKRINTPSQHSQWCLLAVGKKWLYVALYKTGTICRISKDLSDIKLLPIDGATELSGLAVDDEGNVFIADVAGNIVIVADENGKVIDHIGGADAKGALLKNPRAMTIGDDGDLYVVDSALNEILRISSARKLVKSWKGPWDRPTYDRLGVSAGKVYVNNHLGGGFWCMTTSGKFEGLCRRTDPDFPMPGPASLAMGKDGYLYVSASTIGKIQVPR